jgi:hypothetical protein
MTQPGDCAVQPAIRMLMVIPTSTESRHIMNTPQASEALPEISTLALPLL